MTLQPSIINCAGIVFITCPVASWKNLPDLLPPEAYRQELGVELGLRVGDNNEYYIVTISSDFTPGDHRPWEERVRLILQHIWDVLTQWGEVTGPMPEITKGHPLDMVR